MAVLNPAHLIEQAQKLIEPPDHGPPRQVDVRRATSAAYHAAFHALATAHADQFIGRTKRGSAEYVLAYRSISDRTAKDLCAEILKATPSRKIAPYTPAGGFGPSLVAFATAFVELQERRHTADYDPAPRLKTSDAPVAIRTAESAIRRLGAAPAARKQRFLTLLAFTVRGSAD